MSAPIAVPILHTAPAMAQSAKPENARAIAALTAGVTEIGAPGLPGIVATISADAFPVVSGKVGKDARESVVAAAMKGKTRIVAFGHDGYLGSDNLKAGDSGKLLDNALMWTADDKKPQSIGVIGKPDIVTTLQARGYDAVAADKNALANYSTLVINGHELKAGDLEPLRKYLQGGGGMLVATTGWGWSWNDDSKTLARDFVGNQLLAPYGLVWTMGTLSKTSENGFKVEPITPLANAQNALQMLQGGGDITPAQSEQISASIGNALTGLPPDDAQLLPALKAMAQGAAGEVVPFERAPVTLNQPKARLLLTLQTQLEKNLPVAEIKPNPAGAIFPGDVPPNARAVTKTVSVDTKIPQWHSTGLYAAPGMPITLNLPDGMAPQGLSVRIGAHTDTLYHLDNWKRAPDISRVAPLQAGATKFANPFGGLVYIVVPENMAVQNLNVSVAGAFEAPLYVKGKTSLDEWNRTIRWAPAPWAEIATDKIVLTVPSRAVRDVDDPQAVADYYDTGMDAAADLYGIPRHRQRPERIVADVQISAGYMHSGYPIMTWLDVEKTTVDVETLRKFPWGHWHEMGHNHQKGDWTFAGTGEVTNNLLPLYVWMELQGQTPGTGHPALKDADRAKRWAKYEADGKPFKSWQGDPWLALEMYLQMQKAFGWEPFKRVFAEYGALTEAQKPKGELQQHDQWMTRMSRATGHNLGPFFQKWNVPTSAQARAEIANLPAWMPEFPG